MAEFALVFLISIIASFLSSIGGGAGNFILLPALQLLGVSPTLAIGTIKFGAIGIMVGSSMGARNKGVIRKDYLKPLLILIIVASILGPQLTFLFAEDTVKVISSTIITITAIASIVSLRMVDGARKIANWQKYTGYILFFIANLFFAGFGAGMGVLVNYILIGFMGMSPVETISTRRVLGLISIPLQLIFFLGNGAVNIPLGFAILIGTAIGGFIGINTAIKKGNTFVKRAMAAVAIILVITLFI